MTSRLAFPCAILFPSWSKTSSACSPVSPACSADAAFNIDTLNAGPTLDPNTSHLTIVVRGDDAVLEQVTKQLNKLVDVISIQDFRDDEFVDRELVLMRVKVTSESRSEVMQICDIFRAKIVDVQHKNFLIEVTGHEGKINKFIRLMQGFGISELTRTGKVAMSRQQE